MLKEHDQYGLQLKRIEHQILCAETFHEKVLFENSHHCSRQKSISLYFHIGF